MKTPVNAEVHVVVTVNSKCYGLKFNTIGMDDATILEHLNLLMRSAGVVLTDHQVFSEAPSLEARDG